MADELAKMKPGEVKDFLREGNHNPRDFIDGVPETTKVDRTSGWVRGTGSPGGPPEPPAAVPPAPAPNVAAGGQSPNQGGSPVAAPASEDWHHESWTSSTLTPRIEHVLATQHQDRDERALLGGEVTGHDSVNGNSNTTVRVRLSNGMTGYHKSFDGLNDRLARGFGQDDAEQPLFEVAAWRLASKMGPPYDQLVPPVVLRTVNGQLGSFAQERPGRLMFGRLDDLPEWREAALFDSLIGQQDRHPNNYLVAGDRVSLIDHGFAFAKPGDYKNWSWFVQKRTDECPDLAWSERQTLQRVLDSPDQLGLRPLIGDSRADAMKKRAEVMLERGVVISEF